MVCQTTINFTTKPKQYCLDICHIPTPIPGLSTKLEEVIIHDISRKETYSEGCQTEQT